MHRRTGHGGVNRTLAEVRSEYWIIKGRQVVKSIINDCLVCKLFSAMPLPAPETAPLPNIRSVRTRPFQHTGADFAGPIYVKCGPDTKKSYVALFTCATTRAVYLSLASDLSGPTFRLSLEKFVATWGMPNLMVSDNASTFKSTAIQLKVLFDHPEVQSYLQKNFLTWRFNMSLPAWWGGFFERMVGMMKQILRKILGNARLTFEEMEVVLKKTQAILNNRPLTYQGEELEEEPITPNHLIFSHILPQLPDIPDNILEEEDTLTRLKYVKQKLNHVWSRGSKEYLIGLREFNKNKFSKSGKQYDLRPGDIVLIENKGAH